MAPRLTQTAYIQVPTWVQMGLVIFHQQLPLTLVSLDQLLFGPVTTINSHSWTCPLQVHRC